ncbi:MAG: CehA/McbA family metallohydrolase [Candidatus Hydrogenedentes bacterium]|nr:CehA/McbA family metallohydrolase [Candidatus Hydrogenedentota bacterium]
MRTGAVCLVFTTIFLCSAADAAEQNDIDGATTVRIRIVDAASGNATPAMVCISGADGEVRLPPDGRVLELPSSTQEFYSGVHFEEDHNWIGPVRKMSGKGDNNDRSYVYELTPSIPYWGEPVMYQTSGEFTIDLEDGEWRIAVDHGPEYIPVVEQFTINGNDEITQTITMERWVNMPKRGWWSGDVHVHHPTAEPAHREFLLHYAQAADLHIANILEMGHHEGTDFVQEGFGEKFRVRRGDYCLISGQEDPRSTFGHIIGLNLQNMVRDLSTYDFYDITFKGIHEQEAALAGFAHFAWNGCDLPRGFPWYVTTGELDFIELMQFSMINAVDYYDYLNLGFRLTAAAGSDTPWGSTIGEVRTYVYTGNELDPDAWFAGLGKGNTFVTNGPMLKFEVAGQLPGSEIERAKGKKVRVVASVQSHPEIGVPEKLTLVGNEGIIMEADNPDRKSEIELRLRRPINRSQWLVLSAHCENGAQAHTTPVYLTVDGQPTWNPERGPAIIQRQLEAIDKIAAEFDPAGGERERGIHERLDQARAYYGALADAMSKDEGTGY